MDAGRDVFGLRPFGTDDEGGPSTVVFGGRKEEVDCREDYLLDEGCFSRSALAYEQYMEGPALFPRDCVLLFLPDGVAGRGNGSPYHTLLWRDGRHTSR